MILDYNKYKSGVDQLDQRLKTFRAYRTTRRWPCVLFFDLLGLSAYGSWVHFCIKHPKSVLTFKKKRKEFLYQLGHQLVVPLMQQRKGKADYKYLHRDLKLSMDYMINYCNESKSKTELPGSSQLSEIASLPISDVNSISHSELQDVLLSTSDTNSTTRSDSLIASLPISHGNSISHSEMEIVDLPLSGTNSITRSESLIVSLPISFLNPISPSESENVSVPTPLVNPISPSESENVSVPTPLLNPISPSESENVSVPTPLVNPISPSESENVSVPTPLVNPISPSETENVSVPTTDIITISGSDVQAKNLPRGRCFYCKRSKDKKVKTSCYLCNTLVCQKYSKHIAVCQQCEDRVSL